MAGGKRKSTSGRGRGTGKRSSSSGRNGKGNNRRNGSGGPDFVTIFFVLIAVVLVVILLSKYTEEQKGKKKETQAGVTEMTGTPVPDDSVGGPDEITKEPEPTEPPAGKPTSAPTPEPTPTEVPDLTLAQAKKIVEGIVELDVYSIELLDDHLMLDGNEYFSFCINDADGEGIPPLLIVEKKTGDILCYDDTGASHVERFPLDRTEAGGSTNTMLSVEKAKETLGNYPKEALGLEKAASAYNMSVDEWTTIVAGAECYGINLTELVDGKERFRGTFYVAMDGSGIYSMDEATGEFIKR